MNPMLWSLEPAPTAQTVKLFFALKPPASVARQMADLAATIGGARGMTGHWMRADLLHVTLALCHEGRDGLQEAAARAMTVGEGLRQGPPAITFDRTQSYLNSGGQHPFVLCGRHGLDDIIAFRAVIRARMRRAGFEVASSFNPHVTLMWSDRIIAPHPVFPIRWTAEELLLVESHVGQARHRHVARWPLH